MNADATAPDPHDVDAAPPEPPESPAGAASRAELDALVIECLERFESEGDAALQELCARHPAQAAALRSRVDTLRAAGLISGPGVAQPEKVPERLGEFRLLRSLGGGGMGVVYLARQESLGRDVALKLIRPEHLYFPGSRQRFQREVLAVARLQHPGIVPIYTVGEERGIPYFAMERVPGAALDEILRRVSAGDPETLDGAAFDEAIRSATGDAETRPLDPLFSGGWVEACMRVIREAADALEHAHRRGILHRDLKPSNIMVTRDGRVVLLDFGLSTAEGADRLTRSGTQLGSIPYMPPEQVRGDLRGVSRQSDIYTLGVTLYELLALRLPFVAETRSEIQERVLEGRPEAPRAFNGAISEDAETVCLTAMDSDPRRRYASAAEFAQDLTNVLERRPILARRAGPGVRALRWIQRHPAASLATLFGAAALLVAPSALYLQQRTANAAIQRTNDRLDAALARAQSNQQKALEAVDVMLSRVGDETLADVPQMEPVRRALLEDALRLNRELAAGNPTDRSTRLLVAEAERRLGSIQRLLGQGEASESSLLAALEHFRALHEEAPAEARAISGVSNALGELAQAAEGNGRQDEALLRSGEAIAWLEGPGAGDEDVVARLRALASNHALRANVLVSTGRASDAGPEYASAENAARAAFEAAGGSEATAISLASTLCGAARLHLDGDLNETTAPLAEHALVEATGLLEKALPHARARTRCLVLLSDSLINLGILYQVTGDVPNASKTFRRAHEVASELRRDFPSVPRYANALNTVRSSLGMLLSMDPAARAEARALLDAGVDDQTAMVKAHPDVASMRVDLGTVLANLGVLDLYEDRLDDALRAVERGVEELRVALRISPENVVNRRKLGEMELTQTDVLIRLGDHARAAAALADAERDMQETWINRRRIAGRWAGCAGLIEADDELAAPEKAARADACRDAGLRALRSAIDLGYRDADDLRDSPSLDPLRSSPGFGAVERSFAAAVAAEPGGS